MERSNYRISLDIRDSHGACLLDMKRTDTHRRLYITLTDGGVPYHLTEGCHPVFVAKKPDATVIYNTCTVENDTVIYDVTPQTTAAQGLLQCELRLYDAPGRLHTDENGVVDTSSDGLQLLTSATFGIRVHPTVYNEDDTLASCDEVSELSRLVAESQQAINEANQETQAIKAARDNGEFNGISAAHSWEGTVLTVTSASGTSSADLKGEKGDTGAQGIQGVQGPQGEKGDPGEVNIDDSAVGADAWSSKNIIDRLCPSFGKSGSVMQCEPVEGYPMIVITELPTSEDGYNGITLTQCGKNLYDAATYQLKSGYYVSLSAGTTHKSDKYAATVEDTATPIYIPVGHLAGQTITLNHTPGGAAPGMAFYDSEKVFISGGKGKAILVPENAMYMLFTVDAGATDVQIELGSTATVYEAYREQVFTVEFPETVYGGQYNWQSGILHDENGNELYPGEDTPVPALSGINTLYSNAGTTFVIGKADPVAIIEKLTQAVISLGGNI